MGIFDNQVKGAWVTYRATLAFRDTIVGGTPLDPAVVEAWIRSNIINAGLEREQAVEIAKRAALRTLFEMEGRETPEDITVGELDQALDDAVARVAGQKNTVGFKSDEDGLFIESRQVKALLRECTNILYAGDKWGKTRKGPKSFLAERVFIGPARIHLGVMEPSGTMTFVGHITDKQGPRSTLTLYQFVEQAEIEFEVKVSADAEAVLKDEWPRLWCHAQELGLGALRSQDHGKFDIVGWDVVPEKAVRKLKSA